jgi:DNA modification methylase
MSTFTVWSQAPPYWGLRDYGVEGQIGLEASPDEFVARMVEVFAEVRRVMRKDGTLWLNLGDSYSSGGRHTQVVDSKRKPETRTHAHDSASGKHAALNGTAVRPGQVDGLSDKQLIGIPWRVALALQADGWWLRSEIVWHKPAPMPESVRDRPTRAHESVFLLTRSGRYYFDQDAIREPLQPSSVARLGQQIETQYGSERAYGGKKTNRPMKAVGPAYFGGRNKSEINDQTRLASGNAWEQDPERGANSRDVWTIASEGFNEAHFAVMPAELARRCIAAGSPVAGVVLDPFSGAGTTVLVANRLGREGIGIELNPQYAEMSRRRITDDAPLFNQVTEVVPNG